MGYEEAPVETRPSERGGINVTGLSASRSSFGVCAAIALLAGCGGSQASPVVAAQSVTLPLTEGKRRLLSGASTAESES
jgi:hypothetical protein